MMKKALVVALIAVLGMAGVSAFATVGASKPPDTPGNVRALTVLPDSIQWGWNQVGTADGYEVFAGPDSAPPGTPNATINQKQKVDWTHTGLSANTQYCFQLDAFNDKGKSGKSGLLRKYTLAVNPAFALTGAGAIACSVSSGGTYGANTPIQFTAVNGFGPGALSASKYRYVWNNDAAEPNWASSSIWASSGLSFTPTSPGTYYLHLQALNAEDAANPTTLLGRYDIAIPEPSGLLALATGIVGLVGMMRRRRL